MGQKVRQVGWRLCVKRLIDVSISTVALAVSAPVMLVCLLAIRATLGAPCILRQERPGKKGKRFVVNKLRTMREACDPQGGPLPDAERLTSLGLFLRTWSLDEVPQLWNVLRGDMSVVGPRPLMMQYLKRYSDEQARRHEVLPGITGWAQVNGRNGLSWDEKFQYDVWYVEHWSLSLDARILAMTARSVLLRKGISKDGHATMPEFLGDGARGKRGD